MRFLAFILEENKKHLFFEFSYYSRHKTLTDSYQIVD